MQVVTAGGIKVVVAKHEGKTYAFNNKCPHLGLSLKRGKVGTESKRIMPACESNPSREEGWVRNRVSKMISCHDMQIIGQTTGMHAPIFVYLSVLLFGD